MTPVEKLDLITKTILRRWSHELTATELLVVLFVADRTIGWNKTWWHITVPEIVSSNPPHRMRVRASEKTVRSALSRLVSDGYLERQGVPGDRLGYMYAINDNLGAEGLPSTDEEPGEAGCNTADADIVDLPTRRTARGYITPDETFNTGNIDGGGTPHTGKSDGSTPAIETVYTGNSDGSTPVNQTGPITVTSNNNIQPKQKPQHDLVGFLGEAEAMAGRLTDDAVARKVKKAGPGSSADALFAVWRAATIEGFPGAQIMPWSVIEKSKVKKFAALTSDPVTLMDFAAKNWRSVILDKMSWLKSPGPVLPDIGFFLRFVSKFNEALYDEEHYDYQTEMDPTVRLRRLGVKEADIAKVVGGQRG